MSVLELIFADGQWDALVQYKLALLPAHHSTSDSTLLTGAAPKASLPPEALQALQPPTSPATVSSIFNTQEQGKTRSEPARKMAAEICTSCRKAKHYGPCLKPQVSKPGGNVLPKDKQANFNMGLTGSDPTFTTDNGPSTSPGYHSATSAVSSLARAPDGRPADEQAATQFADLFRHQGISNAADEPGRMSGGLIKTNSLRRFMMGKEATLPGFDGTEGHSLSEQRGPTVNPYEERLTRKSTPVAWGPEGTQQIARSFDQIDIGANTDTSSIGGNGFSAGPASLG